MSVATMYTMPIASDPGREHRDVLALGGEQHQLSHAVVVEDLLDPDDAAEQVADLDGDDGDGRDQGELRRTWRRMTWLRREPLHRRGPHVVGLEDLDRAGPGHPRDVAEVHDGHGQGRHQQVVHGRDEAGVRGRVGEDRQPAERPTPTTTTRNVAVTNSGIDDEVTPSRTMARSLGAVAPSGGEDAGDDADRDRQDQGQGGELGGATHGSEQRRHDRLHRTGTSRRSRA